MATPWLVRDSRDCDADNLIRIGDDAAMAVTLGHEIRGQGNYARMDRACLKYRICKTLL
jgi:hypothetical protein